MTSNAGANRIIAPKHLGFSVDNTDKAKNHERMKKGVMEEVKQIFRPEFLNRIDETIFFKALTLQDLSQIVDIQMDYLRKLLKEQEIELEITPDAKELLATRGFNPVYGARPLKRVIRQMVENPLSKMILSQNFLRGDKIKIDVKDDEIHFDKV